MEPLPWFGDRLTFDLFLHIPPLLPGQQEVHMLVGDMFTVALHPDTEVCRNLKGRVYGAGSGVDRRSPHENISPRPPLLLIIIPPLLLFLLSLHLCYTLYFCLIAFLLFHAFSIMNLCICFFLVSDITGRGASPLVLPCVAVRVHDSQLSLEAVAKVTVAKVISVVGVVTPASSSSCSSVIGCCPPWSTSWLFQLAMFSLSISVSGGDELISMHSNQNEIISRRPRRAHSSPPLPDGSARSQAATRWREEGRIKQLFAR
ncbi:hypothetical protein F7725_012120, partial [Dissostichus mawsoni]